VTPQKKNAADDFSLWWINPVMIVRSCWRAYRSKQIRTDNYPAIYTDYNGRHTWRPERFRGSQRLRDAIACPL